MEVYDQIKQLPEDESIDKTTRLLAMQTSNICSIAKSLEGIMEVIEVDKKNIDFLYAEYLKIIKRILIIEIGTYILMLALIIISAYTFIIK